jgi:hypothetical protein
MVTEKEIFFAGRSWGFKAIKIFISKGQRTKEEGNGSEEKETHWSFVATKIMKTHLSGGRVKCHIFKRRGGTEKDT